MKACPCNENQFKNRREEYITAYFFLSVSWAILLYTQGKVNNEGISNSSKWPVWLSHAYTETYLRIQIQSHPQSYLSQPDLTICHPFCLTLSGSARSMASSLALSNEITLLFIFIFNFLLLYTQPYSSIFKYMVISLFASTVPCVDKLTARTAPWVSLSA